MKKILEFSRESFYTAEQIENVTGISLKTLKNWRCAKKGPPYFKMGGKPLYPVRDFHLWMESTYQRTGS
jgi:hypothetical protein